MGIIRRDVAFEDPRTAGGGKILRRDIVLYRDRKTREESVTVYTGLRPGDERMIGIWDRKMKFPCQFTSPGEL